MDELMNIKEAAEYLRFSSITISKLARKRRIPAIKVGRDWRFKKDKLDEWLNAKAVTNRGSILVVDNEPDFRDLLKEIVKDQRHSVVTADSGEAALKEMKKQHFDVIFLNLNLPGIGGNELLEEIKDKDKNAVIVITVAVADQTMALKAISLGPLLLLRKPFREKDIIEILSVVMKPKAEKD